MSFSETRLELIKKISFLLIASQKPLLIISNKKETLLFTGG